MEEYKNIPQEEWLKSGSFERHVLPIDALEHLIQNEFDDMSEVRLVEVGPVPVIDLIEKNHIAPISIFNERNPEVKCVAYGMKLPSTSKLHKQILGEVQMIQGLLAPEYVNEDWVQDLYEKLGGAPNVIYGQYVYAGNNPTRENHPVGVPKVFEASASILENGGFIVIDNIGIGCAFGIQDHWEHSQKMKKHSKFSYQNNQDNLKDDPFIYVMQKRE